MAYCHIEIEQGGLLETEDGSFLGFEQDCALPAGGVYATFGPIPNWWDLWKETEERKIRMRKSTSQRLAELMAKEFSMSDFNRKDR